MRPESRSGRGSHLVAAGRSILAVLLACAGTAQSQDRGLKLAPWPHQVATPQFELRDVNGRPRTVTSFAGSVVVIYFGFLSCPDQCPATLLKLARALKELGPTRRPISILFVTLDPEHDSPKALDEYVHTFDPRIIALTGSTPEIDRAAAAFFVQHARVKTGGYETIDHSTGVFLLNAHGQLQAVGSTQSSVADFVHDLRVLSSQ